MEALRFVVDTLLWLLTLAFVLRLLFQLARVDFRDPMADAIVRVTNWLILPLRRILPPLRKIDTATAVSVLVIAALHAGALLALGGFFAWDTASFARGVGLGLLDMILKIYLFALIVYALTSFMVPAGYAPRSRLLAQFCEPLLKPVRRLIPPIGQIDFSVLWLSIAISAALILLR
jgi:YggT family protein